METPPFTSKQTELACLAKALAHPARIAILEVLRQRQACYCGDIVEELPLAQATVSQHLKVLKDAGLIQGTIDPRRSCYCIDPEGWARAHQLLGDWWTDYEAPAGPRCCE
ncbi:MAG: ArsR family transcriptional regulator [Bacteroidetes bacterium]|nr:MAG: ArsR family transcriptional regulator [Bacteroidota bacterium]